MVGDLVPVEDGLELWWFRNINDSSISCVLVGSQTLHAVYFHRLIALLRVDLLVVEFAQLILGSITFLIHLVYSRERGTDLAILVTIRDIIALLLSQLLLQPALFGLLQYFELPCDQVNLLTAHVPSGIELFIFGIRLRRLINSNLFHAIQNG